MKGGRRGWRKERKEWDHAESKDEELGVEKKRERQIKEGGEGGLEAKERWERKK